MYRVIIADDEELIRAGLRYRNDWNAMGFEVVAMLEDGSDVLKFLEEERADALLTDICMYQVSGLETARVIQEKYPWMKVVLLSGYREFEYAKEAMHCGVYEYLLKPVDYEKLREVFANIKQELDKAQYEEQLLHSLGEEEYDQTLELTRAMTGAVLGEGDDSWLAYAYLKPMMHNAPSEIRQVVVKRLMELLWSQLHRKDHQLAEEFTARLKTLDVTENADMAQALSNLLCQLNDELVARNLVPTAKKSSDDCMQKACNYINNHLNQDFTYKDVADYVHLSPRHFIRRFRSEMGETFTDYVLRIRMEAAMRLLDEGKILQGDVGQTVGYHDAKYFQQIFKKYTGYTVREYQRRRETGNENKK